MYDRKITAHRVPVTMSPTLLTNKPTNSNKEEESDKKHEQAEVTTAFTTDAPVASASDGDASGAVPSAPISSDPTPVLRLDGLIGEEEVSAEDSYNETLEDVAEEINKISTIIDITIPRPVPAPPKEELGRQLMLHQDGLGYVYLKFTTSESATSVKKAVEGRLYNGRKVFVAYYNPEMYEKKNWH